ncbi:MAG: hypothetical protein K2O40_02955 [Lachnospiraceae bacterium]|nr:hypothetical protein [Lachnospiraceae bacterium]
MTECISRKGAYPIIDTFIVIFCPGNIHAATIPAADHNPYTESTTNVKKGASGEGAKWVQWCLWRFGLLEKSEIDGVIGTKERFRNYS